MRLLALIATLTAATVAVADPEVPAPTGGIAAPGAKLEKLFTRSAPIKGGLTEGPAVGPDGAIYFSDIPFGSDKGMILRFDPKSDKTTVFAVDSGKSNGLKFDAQGRLVACEGADEGGRRIARWDLKTRVRQTVADTYNDKKFNAPNDLTIDKKGRIYFSDPKYVGAEPREQPHRSVYRVDTDSTVVEVTHDVGKPNGLVLSPDEKTLYVADHDNGVDRVDDPNAKPERPAVMKVYAFPLGPDGLVNGPRKTIYDFGDQAGCDGMTVDTQGNLYLAVRSLKRPGVLVLKPTGEELGFIPTGPSQPGAKEPVGLPSNVCFGLGDDANTLYITVDKSLYRIKVTTKGLPPLFAR